MFGMSGGVEWIIIALVVLLLFGGKKIPELAKGLGSGIKNFKKAIKDDNKEEEKKDEVASVENKKDKTVLNKSKEEVS
jgi:sec-independent protein translocase protein TatA